MVNKLRSFALAGGGALAAFAAWAAVHYGEGVALGRFGPYVGLGLAVVALPTLAARGKLAVRRLRRYVQARRDHPSFGTVFVSREPLADRGRAIAEIAAAARERPEFHDVAEAEFESGDGLQVSQTGFHDSFVQFSDDDRLVISGSSTETNRLLAQCAESTCSVSMSRSSSNPLWQVRPVRGAPRILLVLVVLAAVALGPLGVATTAYHSDAYNPMEKAVLVSIDARSDLDSELSPTDAKLAKATFMVEVLAEKRVEIRWELNDTTAIRRHAREATVIASDARQLLDAVRTDSPTSAQAARAARIERRLDRTSQRVESTALEQLREANQTTDDGSVTLFPIPNATAQPNRSEALEQIYTY